MLTTERLVIAILAAAAPLAAHAGTFTILHSFAENGSFPLPSGPLLYHDGKVYGVAVGSYNPGYLGSVFKVNTTTGAYRIVHAFQGGADGSFPSSGVIYQGGLLYGTTDAGGGGCSDQDPVGCGTIYSINLKTNAESVINSFYQDATVLSAVAPPRRFVGRPGLKLTPPP
jgi:uncharacterized repeat protein (TIGR03803 family)